MVKRVIAAIVAVALFGALAYLRDPPWLIGMTTAIRAWQKDAAGVRFRWTGRLAAFYVPSDAKEIRVPVATTFDRSGSEAMVVTFSVDGVRAAGVVLTDPAWREVTIAMPPPGSRRVRRIDVRTEPVRQGNHGVELGEVAVIR
jgi:hypothetical protein